MSSAVFKAEMMALTGQEHVSREQFSQTAAQAYHKYASRLFDVITGGGRLVNNAPKLPLLIQGFQNVSDMMINQHNDLNWVQMIGQYIEAYWDGIIITGPTGFVTITFHGVYAAPVIPPNLNFNVIVTAMAAAHAVHLVTLVGTYTSTVIPGVTTPWSGAMLRSAG